MKINKNNYEAWFLDYHEGNLSDGEVGELMDFIAQNPGLKQEFESFEMITLDDDPTPLPFDKEILKKKPTADSHLPFSEEKLIAWHEGDLDESSQQEVLHHIAAHPERRKAFTLYGQTKLTPDLSVVFPEKKKLKKFVPGHQLLVWRQLAVAAAILAFMVSAYLLLPETLIQSEIAENPPAESPATEPAVKKPQAGEPEITPPIARETVSPEPSATENTTYEPTTVKEEDKPVTPSSVRRPLNTEGLLASNPEPRSNFQVPQQTLPQTIEARRDFYWVSFIGQETEGEQGWYARDNQTGRVSAERTSLARLAYGSIERTTGWDVSKITFEDSSLSNFGLWDIAGYGLAGISQLTGSSLTVDKERDENGKITTLAIGDRFKISR